MQFRNLKLYKKAAKTPNYYTSNTSYIQCCHNGSKASSTASALASLSIGAAAGTFVLKNVQKKCLLELEEQQQTYQDKDHLKEDLNASFTGTFSPNTSKPNNTSNLERKRRSGFKTLTFNSRSRRTSFDGFSANVLKVDKNIKINGASPSYSFNMDVFSNNNKYFSKENDSNKRSYDQKAKKNSERENKIYSDSKTTHIKYATAVQLVKNTNKLENQLLPDENDKTFYLDENREELLSSDLKALNLLSVRRSSIVSESQMSSKMLKSTSMQTQLSFDLNSKTLPNVGKNRLTNKRLVKENNTIATVNEIEQQIKVIENLRLDDWLEDKNIIVSEEIYEKTKQIWPTDNDTGFNSIRFKSILTDQIDIAFAHKDYNKIYSLYLAMKRNDCVPSVETYNKIIKSLCLRDMDNASLDERMFNILTCYQDLIGLKIKPLASTYQDIIVALFNGSLEAIKINNGNGKDFYTIALDFFKTTYPSILKHNLSAELVESLLFSSLQYQTNLNSQYIFSILPELLNSHLQASEQQKQALMIKFSFDLQSLQGTVFSCINPSTQMIDINKNNIKDSMLLTSAVLTGLIKLNHLPLASQILNSSMTFFKTNEESIGNQNEMKQELLETYLLQLSQVNLKKAEQLRLAFETKSEMQDAFIPKLSFSFYKTYLYNIMCWLPHQAQLPIDLMNIVKNIFKRLFVMPINESGDNYYDLSGKNKWDMIVALTNNITPNSLSYEKLMNQMLNYCYPQKEQDLELLLMLFEDSVLKNYKFSGEQYFKIFEFLINEVGASDEYILRFVNSHGLLNSDDLQFLNTIVSALDNNNKGDLIVNLSKSKYFVLLTSKFNLKEMNDFEFKGLTRVFESIWSTKQELSMIAVDLGLHSFILNEVFNVEYLYSSIDQRQEVKDFFKQIEENFKERYLNFKKLKLDETKLNYEVEHLATKVLGLS